MKKRNKNPLELNETKPLLDSSPIIPQRSKLKSSLHIIHRPDFTENQKKFIDLVLNKNVKMLLVSGPAGSTKSFLSIYCALRLLDAKRVSDLIYVRSIVEASANRIGFLPGEIDSKINPYMEPLYDKLSELLPKNDIDLLKKESRINAIPISFLRGINWNAKFIFCDEAQNLILKELITLITRLGEHSKVIIAGDPDQSDINGQSGFLKLMEKLDDDESRQNGVFVFRFSAEDILRSKFVKFIVKKLGIQGRSPAMI